MNPTDLIPVPDVIPAPAWIFSVLNILLFGLHILVINVMVGGILITAFSRFIKPMQSKTATFDGALAAKLPTTFAIGVNLGVAPLLFVQVIYGHLIYTSSVLMAVYWILVIPFLILAYYGAYIHVRTYETARTLSLTALIVTGLIVLGIGFIYVNNMTLMLQPEKWTAYFENRGGTILNLSDPTLLPRYLHFLTASVAIGGLFTAIVWFYREKKNIDGAAQRVKLGLKIFSWATLVQVVVGCWYLLTQPHDIMMAFMGGNMLYTIILSLGILLALGAIVLGFLGKLKITLFHLLGVIAMMVISRANLRTLYLQDYFTLSELKVSPQYGVMALFLVILAIGLGVVVYMLRMLKTQDNGRSAA